MPGGGGTLRRSSHTLTHGVHTHARNLALLAGGGSASGLSSHGGGRSVEEDGVQDFLSCGELKCDRNALHVESAEGAGAPWGGELVCAQARAVRARQAVDVAHHVGVEAAQHFHDQGLHAVARGERPRVRPRLVVRAQNELELVLAQTSQTRDTVSPQERVIADLGLREVLKLS